MQGYSCLADFFGLINELGRLFSSSLFSLEEPLQFNHLAKITMKNRLLTHQYYPEEAYGKN